MPTVIRAEGKAQAAEDAPANREAHLTRDPVAGRVVRVVLAPRQVGADVRAVDPVGAPRLDSQVSRVNLRH